MTIQVNSKDRCPHCLTVVRFIGGQFRAASGGIGKMQAQWDLIAGKDEHILSLFTSTCPECERLVITTELFDEKSEHATKEFVLWPSQSHRPVPDEVPPHIAEDYKEAAATLNISPKASAALSRRCLQAVLVEEGGATKKNLAQQIDEVMPNLPGYVAESVDAIRNIGNFAAHPQKSQASGEIINVEPGEAEWNLDVLDMLFDHYYVKPELARQKRIALDAKLTDAGKPPMK